MPLVNANYWIHLYMIKLERLIVHKISKMIRVAEPLLSESDQIFLTF